MNTFGRIFRLTDFGESHGSAIGGVIDGMPAGYRIDPEELAAAMARRRPGQSLLTTARRESDTVHILSGLSEDGFSLGTPIGFIINNEDQRSRDYDELRDVYRPNHADYCYDAKYGLRDHRGGGRASARETACRVVAGAIASHVLTLQGVRIETRLESVWGETSEMEQRIAAAKSDGDSIGGVVRCYIMGLPAGLGEPVFGKLQAQLAAAMMGINGAKGFEYGDGFQSSAKRGSECLDEYYYDDAEGRILTRTNHSGGIQGGISNGMPITMRVAFKPTPTIALPLSTVNRKGESVTLRAHGRHDPCIALRAVPVVAAMAAIVLLDAWLVARLPLKGEPR